MGVLKMSKKPTLLERLLKIREQEDAIRSELKDHHEELDAAKAEILDFDKKIEVAKKALEDLIAVRNKSASVIAILTGGKLQGEKAGRAPGGVGKSKIALELIREKGIGGTITPKEVAERSKMIGGASGAFLKRLLDAGYLEQESPREPYTIISFPEE